MCGRFALYHSTEEVAQLFAVDHVSVPIRPRYNIAPGQPVHAVVQQRHRTLEAFRWGLVPFWAQDARIGHRLINARGETVAEKPAFRAAFRHRRCLIPASGFYEWRKQGSGRRPVYVERRNRRVLALAGLWEEWLSPQDELLHTCAIITTRSCPSLARIHPRMPVILAPAAWSAWLQADADSPAGLERLQRLLVPYTGERMSTREVTPRVNSPTWDDPQCIEPVRSEDDGSSSLSLFDD